LDKIGWNPTTSLRGLIDSAERGERPNRTQLNTVLDEAVYQPLCVHAHNIKEYIYNPRISG
jgi:hypothetical protein